MTKTQYDTIAAAVLVLIQSLFPVLVLTGAIDWTTDTVAAVMLVVTNTMTVIGLLLQPLFTTAASNVVRVDFNAAGEASLGKKAA